MDIFNVCVEVGAVRGDGGRSSRGRPTAYLPTRKLAPQIPRATPATFDAAPFQNDIYALWFERVFNPLLDKIHEIHITLVLNF